MNQLAVKLDNIHTAYEIAKRICTSTEGDAFITVFNPTIRNKSDGLSGDTAFGRFDFIYNNSQGFF